MNKTSTQDFEYQPRLHGELIELEPLIPADFDELQSTASNLDTWADYPNSEVQQSGNLAPWFPEGVEKAVALSIVDRQSGRIIGTTRYYSVPGIPDGIGIGFTFIDAQSRRHGQTNAELKQLMFRHAFTAFDTIWFHVLPDNFRSQAAVKKLGVVDRGIQRIQLAAQLMQYATFSVNKDDWLISSG